MSLADQLQSRSEQGQLGSQASDLHATCEQLSIINDASVTQPPAPVAAASSSSPFANVLALLMAQHPRLGVDSPAAKLTVDCARRILHMLTPTIVIDMGSALCRAGFTCSERPSVVFPTVIAWPKGHPTPQATDTILVGDEAMAARETHRLRYVVEHGIVTDWDGAERVWHHLFYERLRVRPEERPVLLTESPLNPKAIRERAVQIMFDTFNVPATYLAIGAVLALYQTGQTTGVVVDSGLSATHVVPIYEGYALPHAIQRVDIAGRDVARKLDQLLRQDGDSRLPTSLVGNLAAFEAVIRDIKETHAFVAPIFRHRSEADGSAKVPYSLPDGNIIQLSHSELSTCMECLFDPSVIGFSAPGLADVVFNAIMRTDGDLKPKDLFGSIVLSGGSTRPCGFAERLKAELAERAPSHMRINVVYARPDDVCAHWAGGSQLASLHTFRSMWITRDEYNEKGPSIVHSKCF